MPNPTALMLSEIAMETIEAIAQRDGVTKTDVIVDAIEAAYLEARDKPKLSKEKRHTSAHLSELTKAQIDDLQTRWRTSITETITLAVDRFARMTADELRDDLPEG